MCWNIAASVGMSALGIGATGYFAATGKPKGFWIATGYFTAMEILQALSYPVIDQCGLASNQWLTLAGFGHIAFQPLVFNILCLGFIPVELMKRIFWPVIALCVVSALGTLSMLYPFEAAGTCDPARMMCGERVCTYSGTWHLAWDLTLNGYGNGFRDHWYSYFARDGFLSYELAFFFLPLLYGQWRLPLYFYLTGPFLSAQLSTNIDEQPAIWCLLSIAMTVLLLATPVHRFLHSRFPLWLRPLRPA